MSKDNQLSGDLIVLSLAGLVFLIYVFTKPKTVNEEFADKNTSEPESNSSLIYIILGVISLFVLLAGNVYYYVVMKE
jgi:Ca2+/Na+ antiporter